ncbi:MAG: peptidylprolyl isomerase [Candidatus Sumerlaeia bacterium]|nr:peptidylprolyl isomerase [Candidatus Sumerlaeia bacterium]
MPACDSIVRRIWKSLALGLACLAAAAPVLLPAQDAATDEPELRAFDLADSAPLFDLSGKTWTVGEWKNIVRFNPPAALRRMGANLLNLNDFTYELVARGARAWALDHAAGNIARQLGVELDPDAADRIAREADNNAYFVWLELNGILDDHAIPEEELRTRYEERKDEQFRVEEELAFRHLYLSTYEEYAVEEGDTLESIAEKVTGSADRAAEIISQETKRGRSEPLPGRDGTTVDPQPLQTGEILLVPGGPDREAEVRQQAENLHRMATAGEATFEDLAAEYSQTDSPGRVMYIRPERDSKPMLEEVRQAFLAVADGEVTAPFRTRHGYQLLQRVSYRPQGHQPFDAVRHRIEGELIQQRRQKVYDEVLKELWKQDTSIVIDENVLARAFDSEAAEQTICTVGDVLYQAGHFRRDFINDPGEESTVPERRAAMVRLPMIQRHLIHSDFDTAGIREMDIYQKRMQSLTDSVLAFQLIEKTAGEVEPTFTDEELAETFEKTRDSFRRLMGGELWRITLYIDPKGEAAGNEQRLHELRLEGSKRLEELLEGVESAEQFMAVAREHSQDDKATAGGSLGPVHVHTNGGEFRRVLQENNSNSLSSPYMHADRVEAYWIGERANASEARLDDVRELIRTRLTNEAREKAREEFRQKVLDEAGFKLHILN